MGTVSSNEDQQGIFPSEKQLKFSTDNRHQWKKSREYAEAVVNIPGDSAVSSTTKKLSKSKLGNKSVLTSEELRGIYDILISDEPKIVDTCSSYGTDGPRQEVASKRNP